MTAIFSSAALGQGEAVDIVGLRAVRDAEAREWIDYQLAFIDESGVSGARADDAAFFLQRALHERGYQHAEVDWEITPAGRVLLLVDEGVQWTLGTMIVAGNEELEDAAVIELLTMATRERFEIDPGTDEVIPYVADDIDAGIENVVEFYQLLGYAAAAAEISDIEFRERAAAVDMLVTIREGPLHHVGSITLPPAPDPSLEPELQALARGAEDDLFTPALLGELEAQAREVVARRGYYLADVDMRVADHADTGGVVSVSLVGTASWGQPYRLGALEIEGSEFVKDRVFTRSFEELAGQPYNDDEVNEVIADLLGSGAFENIIGQPEPQPDGTVLLHLQVEEAARHNVGLYIGFGSYEGGILGVDYRHVNLFGFARTFSARGEFSQRGLTGEIQYLDPWFLWSDWKFTLTAFSLTRDHEGYRKLEYGGRAEFRRDFGENDRHSIAIFGQTSFTEVTDAAIPDPLLGDRNYLASFAGMSYTYNPAAPQLAPEDGFVFDSSISLSGPPGEVSFVRSTVKLGYYQPMFARTRLRLAARSGAIIPLEDSGDLLPIDLRFFNGGPRSVRSFPERELGPKDEDGHPIGGEFYTIFNAEYEIPIWGDLIAAPFVDAGNLIFDASDAGLDNMRYAAGLSLRYQLPIGPLRLEYGHNLNRGEHEPSGTWHIGFGVAF